VPFWRSPGVPGRLGAVLKLQRDITVQRATPRDTWSSSHPARCRLWRCSPVHRMRTPRTTSHHLKRAPEALRDLQVFRVSDLAPGDLAPGYLAPGYLEISHHLKPGTWTPPGDHLESTPAPLRVVATSEFWSKTKIQISWFFSNAPANAEAKTGATF